MHNRVITAETLTELNSETIATLLVGGIGAYKQEPTSEKLRSAIEFLIAWAVLFTHARDINAIEDVTDFLPEGFSLVSIATLLAHPELEAPQAQKMHSYLQSLPGVKFTDGYQFSFDAIVSHYQILFMAKLPSEFFEASRANDVQLSIPQVFRQSKPSPLKDLKSWYELARSSGVAVEGGHLAGRLQQATQGAKKIVEGQAIEQVEEGVVYVNCQIRSSRNLDHSTLEETSFINCRIYLSGSRIQLFSPLFFECDIIVLDERDCDLFDAIFIRCDLMRISMNSAEQLYATYECWIGETKNLLASTMTRFYPIVINQETYWLCEAACGPVLIRNGVAFDLTNRSTTWVSTEQGIQAINDPDSIAALPSSLRKTIDGLLDIGKGARTRFGSYARNVEHLN